MRKNQATQPPSKLEEREAARGRARGRRGALKAMSAAAGFVAAVLSVSTVLAASPLVSSSLAAYPSVPPSGSSTRAPDQFAAATPKPTPAAGQKSAAAPSPSPTASVSPAPSKSPIPSASSTPPRSPSATPSRSPLASPSPSAPPKSTSTTPSNTPAVTQSATQPARPTATPSASPTARPTATSTAGPTVGPTETSKSDAPSAWARDEVVKAKDYGLIPEGMYAGFAKDITRAEFCALAMALYHKLAPNASPFDNAAEGSREPFEDADGREILEARALGIVRGVGGGYFYPDNSITREEIAVMLYKTVSALEKPTGKRIVPTADAAAQALSSFADATVISSWARDSVACLKAAELMLGDELRMFKPADNTTKEMAFILVCRAYLVYAGQDADKVFPSAYAGNINIRVKGRFARDGGATLFGDVVERYQTLGADEIDALVSGGLFIHEGVEFSVNLGDSLNESMYALASEGSSAAAGISGDRYPIYVFSDSEEESERKKIYAVADDASGSVYGFYEDSAKKSPLYHRSFVGVSFDVSETAPVTIYDAGGASKKVTYKSLAEDYADSADNAPMWTLALRNGEVVSLEVTFRT